MDREKLNEAADNYACENSWYPGETSYESDITAMEESFSDTFKAGAEWLQSQSLSERLTEEEKAKIIKMYKSDLAYARMYTKKMESATDPSSLQKATNEREIFVSGVRMLKTIFGSDLFNDKSE